MTEKLIAQGILRPTGEISQDKINLLSGAYVPPFVEMLWTVTGGDKDTADRVYAFLSGLYSSGRDGDMLEALRYFLFSFLLDYDDVMQDYTA